DVTPNGVFYLPPTGWLTSFYNPPLNKKLRLRESFCSLLTSTFFISLDKSVHQSNQTSAS
ncbi:hypothetical protein FOL82_09625, partial [Lactobacillus reuteri]|nr:hypothetical protein [Limosilactobacillus reuteri]